MQSLPSIALSSFFHMALAYSVTSYIPPQPKLKTPIVYNLELIETPTVIKKVKKQIPSASRLQKKKTKPKLITQKQKSPIKIDVPKHTEATGKKERVLRDARLLQQQSGNPAPIYSMNDRLNKRTGKVVVAGYVDNSGSLHQVTLLESTGSIAMNENCLESFAKYKFEPGQPGWVRMPYEFVLEGEAKTVSIRDQQQLQRRNQ